MTRPGEAGTASGRSSVKISSDRSSVKKDDGTVAEAADALSQASSGSTVKKHVRTVAAAAAAANILIQASGRSSVKKGDCKVVEVAKVLPQGFSADDAASGSANEVDRLANDSGYSDPLLDAVLSWTLEDVTNEDLYKSKIEMHGRFESTDHYKKVQLDYLVEELRARVHSSIKEIQMSEFYEILSVSKVDSSELLFFDIDVARLSRDGFNHSPKDGDVFFLTGQPPKDVQLDNLCFLGVAMEIGADNSFQKENKQLFSDYNEDQVDCITSILPKLACEHEPSVHLIWGSRGTGKTMLACTFMHSLEKSGKHIIVCAPREDSIIQLLKELKQSYPSLNSSDLIVLNDMNATFSSCCLSNRCHMLYCAVYLWKSFTKEMAWILGLKSYLPKLKTDGTRKQRILTFSFISYKQKFLELVEDVRQCSESFISSLSGICLSDIEVDKVNNMVGTLSKFEKLLQNDAINASDVEKAFGIPQILPSPSNEIVCSTANDLNNTRIHCVELIEDLLSAVKIPELNDRNDLERFCIKHSRIVICTPSSSSVLHGFGIKPEILIVDEAAQMTESDLLTPLSVTAPLKHIVLLGDHLHFQPMVESKVCKMTGHGISLFERLINLNFDQKVIRVQHFMRPMLSKIHSKLFYNDRILDGLNVKSDDYDKPFKDLEFPPYQFIDISNVAELRDKGKNFAECSVILYLLESLCNGLANSNVITKVGIVCLCSKQANSLEDQLSVHYEGRSKIAVEVISINNLYGKYDIVILSLVCVDLQEGKRLNLVLSSARHCLWIIGEDRAALKSLGALQSVLTFNEQQTMQSETLYKVMQQLKMKNPTLPKKILHKAGQEFNWKGRPYRTKNILSGVRDQKHDPDTCSLQTVLGVFESSKKVQYACLDPPRDFNWNLSFADLKSKYEASVGEEFLDTKNEERGKRRLETEMDVLQEYGIKGVMSNKEKNFKIKSYKRLEETEKKCLQFSDIKRHLRSGRMMACYFPVSPNFFYIKRGDCYEYDEKKPYIHPKSGLRVSHAVMGIGFGMLPSPVPKGKSQATVVYQNSAGSVFGFDGVGKVGKQSVRGAYVMNVEDLGSDTNTKST